MSMFAGPEFHGRHRPVSVMYSSTSNRQIKRRCTLKKIANIHIYYVCSWSLPIKSTSDISSNCGLVFLQRVQGPFNASGIENHMSPINYNRCCNSIQTLKNSSRLITKLTILRLQERLTCSAQFDEACVRIVILADLLAMFIITSPGSCLWKGLRPNENWILRFTRKITYLLANISRRDILEETWTAIDADKPMRARGGDSFCSAAEQDQRRCNCCIGLRKSLAFSKSNRRCFIKLNSMTLKEARNTDTISGR